MGPFLAQCSHGNTNSSTVDNSIQSTIFLLSDTNDFSNILLLGDLVWSSIAKGNKEHTIKRDTK